MKEIIFTEITQAEYLSEYKLCVHFNSGESKIVDFYNLLFNYNYPVFLPLRDIERFRLFKITDTLEWEDGAIDIAPETVYEMGETIKTDSVAEPEANYNTPKIK